VNSETNLIRSFVERWGAASAGIGDDAAVFEIPLGEKLVVSTDASVENVHFRRADITPAEVGYRAAAAALSDLAAMAARPIGLLFALVLPASWRDQAFAIADGVGEAAKNSRCPVSGGNISSGSELSITTTVLGAARSPLLRSGARPGDSLYVTGSLGAAALAVSEWKKGREPTADARRRFVRPSPRLSEAAWLASNGATSAIDISDGLAADAAHLAECSGLHFTIDAGLVPAFDGASREQTLSGGEDYELLLTGQSLDTAEFNRIFELPLTRIGSVESGAAGVTFQSKGSPLIVSAGFDHLANE
jgi:thiamine-monophosphate kinase